MLSYLWDSLLKDTGCACVFGGTGLGSGFAVRALEVSANRKKLHLFLQA